MRGRLGRSPLLLATCARIRLPRAAGDTSDERSPFPGRGRVRPAPGTSRTSWPSRPADVQDADRAAGAGRLGLGRADRRASGLRPPRRVSLAGLVAIGCDEISYRRGQRYLTCVADLRSGAIIWARPRRNAATPQAFFDELGAGHENAGATACPAPRSARSLPAPHRPRAERTAKPSQRYGSVESARAGTLATVAPRGTLWVTTAPAPTIAPAPIRSPPRITTPEPMDAPFSTVTGSSSHSPRGSGARRSPPSRAEICRSRTSLRARRTPHRRSRPPRRRTCGSGYCSARR